MAELFYSLPTGPVLRITFVQYFNCILQLTGPEATSDVASGRCVGPVIPDNRVKFGDLRTNLSREIPPEAVRGGIFYVFGCSFRPEVVHDIISGANVGRVGMDVPVKFGDSRSNRSRDIRLPYFAMNKENDAGRPTLCHNKKPTIRWD